MTNQVTRQGKVYANDSNDNTNNTNNWKPADAWLNAYLVDIEGNRTKLGNKGYMLFKDNPADLIVIEKFTANPELVKEMNYGPIEFEFQLGSSGKKEIKASNYAW